jgi:AraC family transcriptional regulator, regulatory protein of adaptative response / DNA-3-methyladenine glycosylase II
MSRDARFDGLFFTAVPSTRIYCRSVCPAPSPKRVVYYPTAAAAEANGFRPCLRCCPERAPGNPLWRRGETAVAHALQLIEANADDAESIPKLANRVNISERQLRRQFIARIGATPVELRATRRLLFAKQLLTETRLPIAEVAFASGFGSLRRFNASFRDAYRMAPRDLRAQRPAQAQATVELRLDIRAPYDFGLMLAFLRARALAGIEHVSNDSYARVVSFSGTNGTRGAGWLEVKATAAHPTRLTLSLQDVPPSQLMDTVARVRRMFDLDADPRAIRTVLSRDARLSRLYASRPGLRLPSGWDGFEIAVRAVLGQQVSVAAARTMAARVAHRFGATLERSYAHGLVNVFPAPQQLVDAPLETLGITRARAATIRSVASALLDERVDFRADRPLAEFVERWTAIPGIGPWTAHYLAIRAMGHPDAFPSHDLVLQQALGTRGRRATARELDEMAEAWRPWRAYATLHVWHGAMSKPQKPKLK